MRNHFEVVRKARVLVRVGDDDQLTLRLFAKRASSCVSGMTRICGFLNARDQPHSVQRLEGGAGSRDQRGVDDALALSIWHLRVYLDPDIAPYTRARAPQ